MDDDTQPKAPIQVCLQHGLVPPRILSRVADDAAAAEIARLREEVERLTAALADLSIMVVTIDGDREGERICCECGCLAGTVKDCPACRFLADPTGTTALERVRGLESQIERVRDVLGWIYSDADVVETAERTRRALDGLVAQRDNARRILAAIGERFDRLPSDESVMDAIDRHLAKVEDRTLRFDLDAAGIERREAEAVELVDARARIAELERENTKVRRLYGQTVDDICARMIEDEP
jgi:hypothetical protein